MNFAGKPSQVAGGGELGAGPGPGCGSWGGGVVGLVLDGQKGGGNRQGSCGSCSGGVVVVVVTGGGGGGGGGVLVGVGAYVLVAGGCCNRLRGTQV